MSEAKRNALKAHLESDEMPEYAWGSDTEFECESEEWLVCTDEEADELVAQHIRDSVWAFRASFLASHIEDLPESEIQRIQESMYEDANAVLTRLIGDMDHFIDDAVSADGRGHFLSPYDGEEVEMGDFVAYRRN